MEDDNDLSTPTVKVVGFEVSSDAPDADPSAASAATTTGAPVAATPTAEEEEGPPSSERPEAATPAAIAAPTPSRTDDVETTDDTGRTVHGKDSVKQALADQTSLVAGDAASEHSKATAEEGPTEGATVATADAGKTEAASEQQQQEAAVATETPVLVDTSKLSLRSPVMILPQADTMTMSPMHGNNRRAVDSLFIEEDSPEKKGKKLELDESAAKAVSAVDDDQAEAPTSSVPSPPPPAAMETPPSSSTSSSLTATTTVTADPPPPQQEKEPDTALRPPPAAGAKTNPPQESVADKGADEAAASHPVKKQADQPQQPQQAQQQEEGKPQKQKKQQQHFEKKPKPKLTKAERRAIQERQRAAKAALKAEQQGKKPQNSEKSVEKSSALGKPRKGPQSQYDNEKRVQRQKRKSLVVREVQEKSVELFSHLPQFDNKTLPKSFQSLLFSGLHPEVVKLGQAYANLSISGGNARCVAMLAIFKLVIQDYNTPPGKMMTRDLTNHINVIIQFLIDCRPLAVTMGNAIRFFKTKIGSIHPSTPDMEAKKVLIDTIDQFIQDKIIDASNAIAEIASLKIREGDVILTYAFSTSVLKTFQAAHASGCRFRVIVVDSRPHFEGKKMVSKLCEMGVSCTYAYVTSISYILPQVTSVFIGAASALANGTVVSRAGTAAVAVTANAFNIPVVVCCETYKFSHRVQLDAITHNELGDPDALAVVKGRPEVTSLQNWSDLPNLRLLNLRYDALAEKYITMIATEVGMIPASSVPVILREYGSTPILA